jgi:hypothetical protein
MAVVMLCWQLKKKGGQAFFTKLAFCNKQEFPKIFRLDRSNNCEHRSLKLIITVHSTSEVIGVARFKLRFLYNSPLKFQRDLTYLCNIVHISLYL